jgi:hypothetical protein
MSGAGSRLSLAAAGLRMRSDKRRNQTRNNGRPSIAAVHIASS